MRDKVVFSLIMALIGSAVIGAAIPALVPQTAFLVTPLVCPGGQMTTDSVTVRPVPGTTIVSRMFYCTDRSGTTRELPPITIIGVCSGFGYVASLAAIWLFGRRMLDWVDDGTGGHSNATPQKPPQKPVSVKRANLEQRLAELARTRDAGLITDEEFKRKRKEMLDSF